MSHGSNTLKINDCKYIQNTGCPSGRIHAWITGTDRNPTSKTVL